MTPTAIIEQATADGITLALTPAGTIKAAGNSEAIERWRAILAEHKPGIVTALRGAANDSAMHYRWSIARPNLPAIEVAIAPEATATDVRELYPGADVSPLTDPPRRKATPAEAAELRQLVRVVLADAPHEWDEATEAALADPDAALICWRTIAQAKGP